MTVCEAFERLEALQPIEVSCEVAITCPLMVVSTTKADNLNLLSSPRDLTKSGRFRGLLGTGFQMELVSVEELI